MPTTKISIAIDMRQLRRARLASKRQGISLSAFIGRAVELQLENHGRIAAARALHASWGPSSLPTAADRDAFLAAMARPPRARRTRSSRLAA
jgi:hypothetical protein